MTEAEYKQLEERVIRQSLTDRNDGSLQVYEQLQQANIEPTADLVNKCLNGGINPSQLTGGLPEQDTPRKVVIWP